MNEPLVDQNGDTLGDVMFDSSEGTLITKEPDKEFPQLVERYDETEARRKEIGEKLHSAIMKTDLDLTCKEKGSARIVEVQLQAINTYMGVINDRDKQVTTLENLRLKQKEQATDIAAAKVISKFLYETSRSTPSGGPITPLDLNRAEEAITSIYEKDCDPITAGELDQ